MNNYPETPASTETQDHQPGVQTKMDPAPEVIKPNYKSSDKLKGKIALITGGDSGIGRSVSVLFAREGADIVICYLDEDQDAQDTKKRKPNVLPGLLSTSKIAVARKGKNPINNRELG